MNRYIALVILFTSLALPKRASAKSAFLKPSGAGFDTAKIEALQRDLAERRTTALLIVRHGKIVCEWYAPGNGPEKLQGTASLAKALVRGLSLLLAMNDGRIGPDDLASKYIPFWKDDPLRSRITIREPGFGHFEAPKGSGSLATSSGALIPAKAGIHVVN